jgi:hypothetical protein
VDLVPKLLVEMSNAIRVRQYSLSTERCYVQWVKRLIIFHKMKHPREWVKMKLGNF